MPIRGQTGIWVNKGGDSGQYNVKAYGAEGDDVTDDSSAIQAAIDACNDAGGGTVYFPEGTYNASITLPYNFKGCLSGANSESTTLHNESAPVIRVYTRNAGWNPTIIENLHIKGKSSDTAGSRTIAGIQLGHDTYTTYDEYVGRILIKYCKFSYCSKGIHKKYGGMGVFVEYSNFVNNDYGIYAEEDSSASYAVPVHIGTDTYHRNYFATQKLAAIYLDSTRSGSGLNGQTTISNCVIESCPGFAIFCYDYSRIFGATLYLDALWLENNASDGTTTINGTPYTSRDIYIRNCTRAILNNSQIVFIELVNSTLITTECRSYTYGEGGITKDSDSFIKHVNLQSYRALSSLGFVESYIYSEGTNASSGGAYNRPVEMLMFNRIYDTDLTVLDNKSFARSGAVTVHIGASDVDTTMVADGLHYPVCREITHPVSANPCRASDAVTITSGNYYVYMVDYKHISGDKKIIMLCEVSNAETARLLDSDQVTSNKWYHLTGIFKAGLTCSTRLYINATTDTTAVYRLSNFQIIEFSDYITAVDFLSNHYYVYDNEAVGFINNISSTTASITASTTQTQGQQPLTMDYNQVSVCANANDVVTLPTAAAGMQVVVTNSGAQTLQIFPASGDNLGAGVDTSTTLATNKSAIFQAYDATNWIKFTN